MSRRQLSFERLQIVVSQEMDLLFQVGIFQRLSMRMLIQEVLETILMIHVQMMRFDGFSVMNGLRNHHLGL
jgi:hypothetical protein